MMHPIPQQPQHPEKRHDSAERPRPDTWEQQAAERQRQGFPTFRAHFDDTEGRRR